MPEELCLLLSCMGGRLKSNHSTLHHGGGGGDKTESSDNQPLQGFSEGREVNPGTLPDGMGTSLALELSSEELEVFAPILLAVSVHTAAPQTGSMELAGDRDSHPKWRTARGAECHSGARGVDDREARAGAASTVVQKPRLCRAEDMEGLNLMGGWECSTGQPCSPGEGIIVEIGAE